MAIRLTLPWPVSANHAHTVARGRRIRSARYRRWLVEAGEMLERTQEGTLPQGMQRVNIEIIASLPDRRKRDPDNLLKSILDLLQAAEVLPDDSFRVIHSLSIRDLRADEPLERGRSQCGSVPHR